MVPDAVPHAAPHAVPHAAQLGSAPQLTGLRIEKLAKRYGGQPVLHDIDLAVDGGELVALLGPSGSGKTTLLRAIAGLEAPDSGCILFGGQDVAGLPVQHRRVGFVFQSYALFRHMRVVDNIGFGLAVRRRNRPPKAEIRRRAEALLELVQLGGLGRRFPHQLSGGQRQRVALARALAIDPQLLLLDEPFGALDAKVRRELRRWLRSLHDATGHTTLFVTHDQEEALELADRVVVMQAGRIVQQGAPAAIYDAPATAFVFSFIGESTALPVEVAGGGVLWQGRPLAVARLHDRRQGSGDGPALLAFRPHDAEAVDESSPLGGSPLCGRVLTARRHGAFLRVSVPLEGPNTAGLAPLEADLPADAEVLPGATLQLRLRQATLYDAPVPVKNA